MLVIGHDATDEQLEQVRRLLVPQPWKALGVDVETITAGKEPEASTDRLYGIGIAVEQVEQDGGYIQETIYGLADNAAFMAILAETLPRLGWYAFNAMYDATVLRRYGIHLGEHLGDARIIAYLLGEPEAALKPLLQSRFGITTIEYKALLDQFSAADISGVPLHVQADYCANQDARYCIALARQLETQLSPRLRDVYRKIELPMVNILIDMSEHGIAVDRKEMADEYSRINNARLAIDQLLRQEAQSLGFTMYKQVGGKVYVPVCSSCHNGRKKKLTCPACNGSGRGSPQPIEFNPGSDAHISKLLHEVLGLPVARWLPSGEPSTDRLALLKLQERHSIIPILLSRRKLIKTEQSLQQWLSMSEADGRLHTQYTNTRVVSGRLSSRLPNLQQVTLGLRHLFVADPGTKLVAADESQLELRIAAYMSKDKVMIDILRHPSDLPQGDMHSITAAAILGVAIEDFDRHHPMRQIAKVINYLSNYGGKARKLIEGLERLALEQPELGISIPSLEQARKWLDIHKRLYSGYWEWVDATIARTHTLGYSETAFGRRRWFRDIESRADAARAEAERAAVNHCIQGSAADLLKQAMINISNDEVMTSCGRMLLQVHDEIVSVVEEDAISFYAQRLAQHLCLHQPFKPDVELVVDVGIGTTWKETHK